MDSDTVRQIKSKLEETCRSENINIPLAVESGSRAWGFPSPDSDYDCRFLYVRRWPDAVALFPPRDVIELPLTPVFDINGWDVAKALKLALKGNAVVIEWLNSPIHYWMDTGFQRTFAEFASRVFDPISLRWHYSRLLLRDLDKANEREGFTSKRFFYLLRPALALRFLRQNPGERNLPMNIQQICSRIDLSHPARLAIDRAVELKAALREKQRFEVDPEAINLVTAEADLVRTITPPQLAHRAELAANAQAVYARILEEYGDPQ